MMKPFLAASLALNLGLVAFIVSRNVPSDPAPSPTGGKPNLIAPAAKDAVKPPASTNSTPPINRAYFEAKPAARELAQRLHREGWPDYLIKAAVGVYIAKGIDQEMAALTAQLQKRYWERDLTSKTREARLQLIDRQNREISAAMEGIPVEPWATTIASNATKFGDLTAEQIARVERIEADYRALERDETPRNKTIRERDVIMGNLADERRADLVKTLGEEGYFNYMARTSEAASRLKMDIEGLGIDESQYLALFKDALAWSEKYQNAALELVVRQEAEIARQTNRARYEQVLGQEKFVQFLELREPGFRSLSADMGRMSFTSSDSLALWKIVSNANLQLSQIRLDLDRGKAVDPDQASAVARQALESARQRFGSDAFAGYLATNPRWLTQLTTKPSQIKKSP